MEKRVWYSLYDKVYKLSNLEDAFQQVKKNKGASGVDKVTVHAYEQQLEDNLEVLQQKLKDKTYRPKPVRRKMIEKDNGKQRPLGIPTVEDRLSKQLCETSWNLSSKKIFFRAAMDFALV